jgi:hypothetical protein
MNSRIRDILENYAKFESILPDELVHQEITEALTNAKNEINKIVNFDLENIKNLASKKNKSTMLNEITKPASIIKKAFYLKDIDGPLQDQISFYYAHWMMSLSTLQSLTHEVIRMSAELQELHVGYINASKPEKRTAFSLFIRGYQDFYGFLINIRNLIIQYYDLFVQTCNEIDPNNKEQTMIAYKSDIGHDQLLSATKELLLRGNFGRLSGFILLRSAIEVFVTRELFDMKKSKKYINYQITFTRGKIPSLNTITKKIEQLNLNRYFKTDSLRRLYTWQSIVAHRGSLSEEYLIWFVYHHTAIEIIGAFRVNLTHYRDQILEKLQTDDVIEISKAQGTVKEP